ncbi:hypothetical protein FDH66_gp31 [Arthrobacter phage Amigo]|uniref:Uncharacterized protein n=5 Tax=Amigovirus amigo TaxID=1982100 RepID=A0A5J6TCQ0_9CAUD|nr:hypothetical protein FDH66_gp31 [Arthrobacter phage Amigo]QFG08365.1 hypothetical protein SEA_YEEZUS_73 [Arthrobacter phage Yeezus]QFG13414.1 hypothetical protein SEA_ICHOR_73 [Arthrobacter phage Ichor]QFG13932.1 hypothetical protein SEA_JAEK_73 [Arthrobacter phage Jaek]QJD51719.1 hypothetical protein SEA_BOERSMA_76 [Arthrobacter phage Boersma]ALY08420.1 hypothetical protein AMIGO_74 [Arthrobacter phage Amigo]
MSEQSHALEKAIKLQRTWQGLASDKRAAMSALEAEHRQRRADVKEALHEAIRDLFRQGMTVPQVSNLTNNTNYSLLYKLKADSGAPKRQVVSVSALELEDEIQELPDVDWEFHDHIGVHGWLISDDRKYVKFYGQKGTPFEGEWAIVSADEREFVGGNIELNNAVSAAEFDKKTVMLVSLLDGTYTGPTRVIANPYTD